MWKKGVFLIKSLDKLEGWQLEFNMVKEILWGIKKIIRISGPWQIQYKHRIQKELVDTGTFSLKLWLPDTNYLCYVFSFRWLFVIWDFSSFFSVTIILLISLNEAQPFHMPHLPLTSPRLFSGGLRALDPWTEQFLLTAPSPAFTW